ncbi:MAG: hypothetical protein WAP20_10230 [Limnochordia bacterium]|nr:hypothetical protein [Bacillota bacterium]HOB09529.1 hypothetical protein [Limnochordia bacterium]NLH31249.1 hypothetical protein [Bacillota bacterium]HPT93277.1 hypothetical protein [Limnochordia bacterium]HPZ30827.1 hypothetical protein [Limnochordia bacterium]
MNCLLIYISLYAVGAIILLGSIIKSIMMRNLAFFFTAIPQVVAFFALGLIIKHQDDDTNTILNELEPAVR